MALASLGGVPFRINPSQVTWSYEADVNVIPTVGGRVVQVLGVTMGDMTIQGLFGHDRAKGVESGDLAEAFMQRIAGLVDQQSALPTMAQLTGADPTPMHPTVRFIYNDEADAAARNLPGHNWDFNVYIKSLKDVSDPNSTITHRTGKYSYGYTLTLFIMQDNTGKLTEVATNSFIDRLSSGLGWKRSTYNGQMTAAELQNYLQNNSPDGTIHGLVLQQFQKAGQGQVVSNLPTPANPGSGTGGPAPTDARGTNPSSLTGPAKAN